MCLCGRSTRARTRPSPRNQKSPPLAERSGDQADEAAPPLPTKPTGPKGTVVGVRLINEPTGLRGSKDPNLPTLLPPPEIVSPGPDMPRAADPGAVPPGTPPLGTASHPAQMGSPAFPGPAVAQPALPGPAPGPYPGPMSGTGPIGYAPQPHMHPPEPGLAGMSPLASTPSSGVTPVMPSTGVHPVPDIATDTPAPAPAPKSSFVGVLVAVVFFLAGIAAAVAGQTFIAAPEPPPTTQTPGPTRLQTIHPAGEVLLQATPPEAVVVSEHDGQVLGSTPMRFLVPPDVDYAVLVTAAGHEPIRLELPKRGRMRTDLVPLDGRPPCRMLIKAPKREKLIGVSVEVAADDLYSIAGAAVLRSPSGRGAWLVRCPSLGGDSKVTLPERRPPTRHQLSVLSPAGATVSIDDAAKGPVPYRETLPARFTRVKAETPQFGAAERWVPLFAPTQLKMPKGRPARPEKE